MTRGAIWRWAIGLCILFWVIVAVGLSHWLLS